MGGSTELEARLRFFFADNNPSIVSEPGKFSRLLQTFAGREDELIRRLEKKYYPAKVADSVQLASGAASTSASVSGLASERGFIQMNKRGRSTNGPKGTDDRHRGAPGPPAGCSCRRGRHRRKLPAVGG